MISSFFFDTTKVLFRKRLFAQLIDYILVYVGVGVLTTGFSLIGPLFYWIWFWAYLIYAILMDAYRGGTVGKSSMGLKVINTQEGSSRLLTSFYRNVTKISIATFFWGIYLLIYRKGYSGFHNKIAGTKVVEK